MVLAPAAYAVKPTPVDPPPPVPTGTLYESTDPFIVYTDAWSEIDDDGASGGSYSSVDGEGTASVSFDGSGIQVMATTGPAFGKMEIMLDGGEAQLVDLYSASTAYQQIVWSAVDLAEGVHSVELAWSGEKHRKSTSAEVNIDAVDVLGSLSAPVVGVTGDIAVDTVWAPPAQYLLSGTTSVKDGVTLTIQPGTVVKFASGASLQSYGRIVAGSPEGDLVAFTSLEDDSLGGDTNLDSDETTPAAGDWGGLRFFAGSDGSVLTNCTIQYARDGIYAWQGSFALADSTVALCSNYGVRCLSLSSPSGLDECILRDNMYTGLYSQGQSGLTVSDCTVTGNGRHGIALESSSVTAASVNIVGCTITGNGTADYSSVYVDDHSNVTIEDCTLGGGMYGVAAMTNSVVTAADNTITDCSYAPFRRSNNARLELAGNATSGNLYEAIHLSGTVTTTATVGHEGLPYVIDGQWTVDDSAAVTIDPGAVFKFLDEYDSIVIWGRLDALGDADNRITFTSIADDAVGGDTNADGTSTTPTPGSWYSIRVSEGLYSEGPGVATFDYCDIKYGGNGSALYAYAALSCSDTTPTISNSRFLDNLCSGIEAWSSSPAISDCLFERNGNGISFGSYSSGTVTDCEFRDQRNTGIYTLISSPSVTRSVFADNARSALSVQSNADDPVPEAHYNDFLRNGSNGSTNLDLSWYCPRIDARCNYWGRTSGPSATEQADALCEPWLWYTFKTPKSAQVLGGNTWCGIWGEPVNTSTGNFYYQARDLTLPGVGPEISVGRTYNHQSASVRGVLGHGWTLDCESFVQPQSDGSALMVYPGGARKTFTPDGSGGYVAPQGTLEELASAPAGGWTLTYLDRTVNTYGSSGTLLSVADRYGNIVLHTRNASGAITMIEGCGGRSVTFTYTGDLLTRVADSAGREVTYAYSAAGDLVTVTDVTGAVTTYTSDADHRVTQVASAEHPADPFVSHGFDDADRVAVQYDGYGNVGTLDYAEGATTITNNRGFTEIHRFDDEFRLTEAIDGAGHSTHRTYNAAGLVESVTDGNGHTTSFTYDQGGNQTSATDAAGHTTRAGYDLANNNILWSEDAEGVRTTYSHDASGTCLVSAANPVFEVVYGHYANGLVSDVTRAGATTHYAYDAAGRLTEVTDPLGATSAMAYDVVGNLTSTTDALGRTASFTYDAAGRVLTATDPAGETVSYMYDRDGNRTSATDALGHTTHFAYDELDKLAGVTDPLSNSWAYTYDPNYSLSTVTNPRGATTSYTYSANDLLVATTDALGHTWAFTHDAAGNTLSSSYPTGESVSRTYTPDDLLAASAYSTGQSYAFAYTPAHRLSSVTDGSGRSQSFTYNPVGWLLSATDTAGGTAFATTYGYDAAGRVTSLDSGAAPELTYAYDLAGRLASLEASGAVATFTHDAAGARTGMVLPSGAATSYGYDAAGRIESIVTTAASGVIAESYTRDAAGRVTSDSSGSYAYDDAGRLVTWTAPDETVTTYTYDAAYNLTGESVDGSATASFTYDAADRITNDGFTYDEAGSLTSDGTRLFTYDAACRLISVADASTETTIATYTYDAFNRRVSSTEGTATVFFHYDGTSARVIAETDASGATLATYAYDSSGTLFLMTRGGETYYYHTNARGDVVAMSDATGAVVNTYAYDPWGQLLSADETVSNPYRYASYRHDTSTGLSYCWNRYYAPELGRFLTRDIYPGELPDPVTMNPYLYCGGDPVNRVDPSGMLWSEISLGFGVAAAVVGTAGLIASSAIWAPAALVGAMAFTAASMYFNWRANQVGEVSDKVYAVTQTLSGVSLVLGPFGTATAWAVAATATSRCVGVASTATSVADASTR